MKIANVCFLTKDDQILLALKKRGFGMGKLNGVGGKVQEGETVEEAMCREAFEEIGVAIDEKDLEKRAEIEFHFPDKDGWDIFVHVFFTSSWKGEPQESEEMAPQWFPISNIPVEKMWVDDRYWLDDVVAGKKIRAKFFFKGAGDEVGEYEITPVDSF